MKRKGSRMTIARSFEQQATQDTPRRGPQDTPTTHHKPLENSSSHDKKNTIMEETEDELAAAVVTQEPRKDEGLGESFDQQSEMSDSGTSLNSRAALQNGKGSLMKSTACDVLQEEGVVEEAPVHDDDIVLDEPEDSNQNSNNSGKELTLDPTRLEGSTGHPARLWRKAFVPNQNEAAKLRSRARLSKH